MIPVFASAGVLIAPSSPLQSSGYVPGNTLGAQTFNWFLGHLTAELCNLLTAVGISPLSTDDTQVRQAVGRTNTVISTSGAVITAAQFVGDALVQFTNASGSSSYNIGSGAARIGVQITLEALSGSGVTVINAGGSAFLSVPSLLRLVWDGSAWAKVGGGSFIQSFLTGTAATWKCPWTGTFKATVVGGGGGGGGARAFASNTSVGAGGGGGGGTAIKALAEVAGATLTYTIGAAGTAGASTPTDGGDGGDSTLSDGAVTLTGGKGHGGVREDNNSPTMTPAGGSGGTASGGDLGITGQGGGAGTSTNGITAAGGEGGMGGSSFLGGGGHGTSCGPSASTNGSAGIAGGSYGGGGSGASAETTSADTKAAGGAGAAGVIVIEF